jgi:hypothetical protein
MTNVVNLNEYKTNNEVISLTDDTQALMYAYMIKKIKEEQDEVVCAELLHAWFEGQKMAIEANYLK